MGEIVDAFAIVNNATRELSSFVKEARRLFCACPARYQTSKTCKLFLEISIDSLIDTFPAT